MRYQITKPEHGSEHWLAVRWCDEDGMARISASVAGAVHGENKYTSAADLAMELLSDTPPTPVTGGMYYGSDGNFYLGVG